jgi:hypothetical protein
MILPFLHETRSPSAPSEFSQPEEPFLSAINSFPGLPTRLASPTPEALPRAQGTWITGADGFGDDRGLTGLVRDTKASTIVPVEVLVETKVSFHALSYWKRWGVPKHGRRSSRPATKSEMGPV